MDNALFQDPMTFYSIAFVIFLALAYKYGKKPLLGWVDAEITKVRDELEQAKKLRIEAEAVLATYKTKQAEALAEAEGIIRHAHEEAQNLKKQAEADLNASLARHEQQAAERIRLAEIEATTSVRQAAIELAMKMAHETLATKIDATTATKLIDQSIAEIPALAQTKARAA